MVVVSVKTEADSQGDLSIRKVDFADGTALSFSTAYIPAEYSADSLCLAGRELSDEETESLNFAAFCYRTEQAALRLVARAEQCVSGLSVKLETRGHAGPVVRAVLNRLCALGIIDDERFARLWLRSHLRLGGSSVRSPRNLLLALRRRGISQDTARTALKAILDPDTEMLLLRQYLKNTAPDPAKSHFWGQTLKYEGFSPAVLEIAREELAI